MTRITSAIAAALIASASFASVALADGDYYEGVQKTAPAAAATHVDRTSTGSIGAVHQDGKLMFNNGGSRDNRASDLNSGDYYDGANRPN
ncbi:hypothetical protein [Rhizobium terrae]|uniref:hypothetical protein n=1 Tax=Rhizobium terrae TaxID=2171756 RepID=UPI000E3E88A1|nr:hypothetical protein [Rhizobium terrae]